MVRRAFLPLFLLFAFLSAFAQQPAVEKPNLAELYPTLESKENALRNAKIIKSKKLGTGITNPLKLTLQDGNVEFYAVFKNVDMRKSGMTPLSGGAPEMDFKDSWQFDVAAYELDKMLGLNMIPPTVERRYDSEKGALQWWVENAMTEKDRMTNGLKPPDVDAWNREMFKVRLFDNLIYNIDRNLGNLLITPDWKVWMIDHSRCFKNMDHLKSEGDLTRFSLSFVSALKKLDEPSVKEHCGKYLSVYEIRSMLKRRDEILQKFDKMRAEIGDSILYP